MHSVCVCSCVCVHMCVCACEEGGGPSMHAGGTVGVVVGCVGMQDGPEEVRTWLVVHQVSWN